MSNFCGNDIQYESMNVTSYVQHRQYGATKTRRLSQRNVEVFLENKLTNSFVNKACEISGRCRSTFLMQFSPDGTKVASTHGDHSVRVTDIATGKCLHTLNGHPRTPWSLAYHPSFSNILASGCLGGQIRIWDLYGHGCEIWNTDNEAVVASLTFHPTDKVLVIAAGNTVYFWDWTKPEPFTNCSTSHDYERIRWVRFDSLGHTLYTGISNNTSAHRDQLPDISHTGEDRQEATTQPSRLSSVYNNIVSYYQDYRRDRLLGQLAPTDATAGPAVSTGARWATEQDATPRPEGYDVYPGLHNEDIVGPRSPNALSVPRSTTDNLSVNGGSDLPFASYASQISHASRGRWRGFDEYNRQYQSANVRPSTQSVFGSLPETERDLLLNPTFDPFLSSTTESAGMEIGTPSTDTGLAAQAVDSERHLAGRRLPHASSLAHHIPDIEITEEIEIPLEAVTGQHIGPPPCDPRVSNVTSHTVVSNVNSGLTSAVQTSTYSRNAMQSIFPSSRSSASISDSHSVPMLVPPSQLLSRFLQRQCKKPSDTTAANSPLVSSRQSNSASQSSGQTGSALVSSGQSNSASQSGGQPGSASVSSGQSNSASQSSGESGSTLLAASSTRVSSGQPKVFASIRERLQSSIPLYSVTGSSSSSGKVSHAQAIGIPKVTVIMSNHTGGSYTSQVSARGTNTSVRAGQASMMNHPVVSSTTVTVGANKCSNNSLIGIEDLSAILSSNVSASNISANTQANIGRPVSQPPGSSNCRTVDSCPRTTSPISTAINRNAACAMVGQAQLAMDVSSIANNELPPSVALNATATAELPPSVATNMSSILDNELPPPVARSTPTVVASTSSHSTLFENIFHNSNAVILGSRAIAGHHGQGRNYLQSFRSQPYWQNRSRYLALTVPRPYQNRNVDPLAPEPSAFPTEVASTTAIAEGLPMQNTGRDSAAMQRDQASSDTENELSAHLHGSGAYFMPIPESRRRPTSSASLGSSASLDGNTDPALARQFNISAESTDSLHGQINESDSSQGQRSESAHSQRSSSTAGLRSRSNSQDYEVELVVDQNENYTTNQNRYPNTHQNEEIVHRDHDSNNNSIHITVNTNSASNVSGQRVDQRNPDYVRLRDSFVSMTDQIEREMNDLNRRINALRDSFNESIRSLRHDRRRYESVEDHLPSETATNLGPPDGHDVVTLNAGLDATDGLSLPGARGIDTDDNILHRGHGRGVPISQPPTLLETSLRSHTQGRRPLHPGESHMSGEVRQEDTHHWRTLQRHYLHPHYSSSILDDTINRPNNVIQSAINRAIAGAFMGTGESAVANNIINQTHRIQYWDFTKCHIPDISESNINIVVPHCKLHNSASADISQDNTLLATFVPNHQGFPDNNILAVYSLLPATRGQCLYTKQFGPNAVSVSISPSNNYILVCLAARRLSWVFTNQQLVAHIYKLEKKKAGENSMKHVMKVDHACSSDVRTHVSGNSARWLPLPGQGLVYGTNRGDLHICRPGVKVVVGKADSLGTETSPDEVANDDSFQRLFGGQIPWRTYPSRSRVSISTQTAGVRRSAGTQTSQESQ